MAELTHQLEKTSPLVPKALITIRSAAFLMILCALLFTFLAAQVTQQGPLTTLDRQISAILRSDATVSLDDVMFAITLLGYQGLLLIILAVLVALRHRGRVLITLWLITYIGAASLTELVKHIVMRARPPAGSAAYMETGFSFPSGHATWSAALYLTIVYLTWTSHLRRGWVLLITGLCTLLILVIPFTRVYLGVHYVSDVLAGFALGIGWSTFCIMIENAIQKRRSGQTVDNQAEKSASRS